MLGLGSMVVESDGTKLWQPQNSRAWASQNRVEATLRRASHGA